MQSTGGSKEDARQSGKHEMIISESQIDHFMEKVIPGLMKLGHVHIAESISKRMGETPLRVKLFLDRVKHRITCRIGIPLWASCHQSL